jgi:hypothetical protein
MVDFVKVFDSLEHSFISKAIYTHMTEQIGRGKGSEERDATPLTCCDG